MVERQFNTTIKNVQSDLGGEFRSLTPFFTKLGIIHRRSCPHTSEQNGIVERRHRHVVETGLALLAQSHLPQRFWQFAFDTAVYLINRLPSRLSSNKSPFQQVYNRKPDYSFLRVFGCECFPHLRPYNRHKLDFRTTPCVFLGYSPVHHGYRCFDPTSERIYIVRHVRFNEHVFPFQPRSSPTSNPPSAPYTSVFPTPPPNPLSEPNSPTDPISAPLSPTPPTVPTEPPTPPSPTEPPIPPPTFRPRPSHLRPNPKPTSRFDPTAYTSTRAPAPLPNQPLLPSPTNLPSGVLP